MPLLLTYKDRINSFQLYEYWTPKKDNEFDEAIQTKFPQSTRNKVLNYDDGDLIKEVRESAKLYFSDHYQNGYQN